MLRSRVKLLEAKVKLLRLSDAPSRENREFAAHLLNKHTKKIKQLECGNVGHYFDKWERTGDPARVVVQRTCSECGYVRRRFPQALELKEIKALLELGILFECDLPEPKPRKKARK